MATSGLAGQRNAAKTYGSKTRSLVPPKDDLFGERPLPSGTHAPSRSQPTKSLWDASKLKAAAATKRGGGMATSAADVAAKKRDVFDFPSDSEDDKAPKAKRLATSKQKDGPEPSRMPTPSSKHAAYGGKDLLKKKAPITMPKSATLVNNGSQGRAPLQATAGPKESSKPKTKEKSNVFDFPDSDEEHVSKKPNRKINTIKKSTITTQPKVLSTKIQSTNHTLTSADQPQKASKAQVQSTTIRSRSTTSQKALSRETMPSRLDDKEVPITKGHARSTKPSSVLLPHRALRSRATQSPEEEPRRLATTTRRTATFTKRKAVLSGSSAPAILSAMVEESTSTSESPPSQPMSPSPVPSAKFDSLRTPSPRRSPSIGFPAPSMIETPRNNALWGKLLNTLDDADSSLDLPISTLKLSTARKRTLVELPKASSDLTKMVPRKRVKLIETLKHARTFTGDEGSDEESDISEDDHSTKPKMSAPEAQIPAPITFQTSSKTTYGQHRSRLADQNEEEEMMDMLIEDFSQPLLGLFKEKKKDSYDLQSESSDEDEGGQPKSAHDLRAAGSKKRMLQDLESLVSGIEGEGFSSMSSKRSDLLDLTKKCFEQEVVDLILDHELDRQLLATFSKSTDAIFDFLAATCLGFLVKDTKQITVLREINRSGFTPRLMEMLDIEQDIGNVVKERRFNMSGIAQKKMRTFREPLLKSDLWSELQPTQISPQVAALRTLELLIRRSRELGTDEGPLNESGLLRILRVLEDHVHTSASDTQLELILSILESSSIGYSTSGRGPWSSKAFKTITHHLPSVLSASTSRAGHMRNLALRLILNLTNNNAKACNNLATSELIDSLLHLIIQGFKTITAEPESEDESQIDELILSLGAMINLAELSASARQNVISPGTGTLAQLVQIFSTRPSATAEAASIETTRSNVTYGYLSLLIINLCQTDALRAEVLRLLPERALGELIAAAEEFIAIHQKTDRELFAGGAREGEANVHTEYTRRLMGMVYRLKEAAAKMGGLDS